MDRELSITPPPADLDSSSLPSLAERIGTTKVYLLADSIPSKLGKRKYEDEVEEQAEPVIEEVDMEEDPSLRNNAILLTGSPIANLPTSNIFAYSTHFDAKPIGLEWIDDTTCILVFESKALAVAAHLRLQKLDEVDMDGFLTAQPIPMAIWPPELRINEGLGKGEGLRGVVRMRWARKDDVKEKGARNKSQFYKKHGNVGGSEVPTQKRRRGDGESEETLKARLDNDLDAFLAQDDEEAAPASPPSKMRSDNMDSTGQSLVDRTSIVRVRPPRHQSSRHDRNSEGATRRGKGRREPRAPARQTKSQQELDDELDAFLNEKE